MTNAEREERLKGIRERVAFQVAAVGESERWRVTAALDVAFLLSELDAALGALHDRDEETGYTRGFEAGLEEGAKRERQRLLAPTFPNPDLSEADQAAFCRVAAELTRAAHPHTRRLAADMQVVDLDTADACPPHDWELLPALCTDSRSAYRCRRCGLQETRRVHLV